MSKKSFGFLTVLAVVIVSAGAASAFAANGHPPAIPAPFQNSITTQNGVHYVLSLTKNGITNSIPLNSWQWGISTPEASGTAARESVRPMFSALSFTADSGALSPAFMLADATGDAFTSAKLVVTKNGVAIITIALGNPRFSSYQMSASASSVPVDAGSLTFTTISVSTNASTSASWDVLSQKNNGATSTSWNLMTAKAS